MNYLENDLPDGNIGLTQERQQLYAMTKAMDRACGQIIDKLEELGLTENTLIVFSNDNGGAWINDSSNYPLSGVKGTHLEGGIRVPFLLRYGNRFEGGSTFDDPISTFDHLKIVLNYNHGVPFIYQGINRIQQFTDIVKV